MDRQEKNPYVTKIELDERIGKTERELGYKIDEVDKKHEKNYSTIDKSFSIMSNSFELIVETLKENTQEVKGMRQDNLENNKELRTSLGHLDKTVSEHDLQLDYHDKEFIRYGKVLEGKRISSGKWIGIISSVFVAFISGMFGLSYIVAEYVLPLILGK